MRDFLKRFSVPVRSTGGVSCGVFLSHIMSYHGPTIGDSPKCCNVLLVVWNILIICLSWECHHPN